MTTVLATVALAGHLLLAAAVIRRMIRHDPLDRALRAHAILPRVSRYGRALAVGVEAAQLVVGAGGVVTFVVGGRLSAVWTVCCVAGAVLYLAFTGYLTVLLRVRGAVPCACFGQRERVGVPSVVRAGVCAAAMAFAAAQAGLPVLDRPVRLVALAAAVVLAAFAVHLVALTDAMKFSGRSLVR